MSGGSTNQATVYDSVEGKILREAARTMGAKPTYFTKKMEFFALPNGKVFLLEPDREGQVNLGFKQGFGPMPKHPLAVVGKNSNVRSHWRLRTNEFIKLIVSDSGLVGAISTDDAVILLRRFGT